MAFHAGEVHALMGANGAGKSTLAKVIAGLLRPDAGTVWVGSQRLKPGSISDAFDAGVRIVHQELAQCPNLSVAENLCLRRMPKRGGLVDFRSMASRAASMLESLEPGIDLGCEVGRLSPGHRQVVQIAGALDEHDGSTARLLVLDEPTSSLSVSEVERLHKIVRRLAARGLSVVYVSHRMKEIFDVCDRVTVLRNGESVGSFGVGEVDEDGLVERMIGRRVRIGEDRGSGYDGRGGVVLEVCGLRSSRLDDVSLRVRSGEVVGVGGLVGSGRSELLNAIFGLDPRATGRVVVGGSVLADGRHRGVRESIRAGVGYVPEDRHEQGLFYQLGLGENVVKPVMGSLARLGMRSSARERAVVGERVRRFQVHSPGETSRPGDLSGGNQQKLLIARWMSRETRVLLLDEPTRGIDVGTKSEIHRLVRQAAREGAGVLLVSSEMEELLGLSDRVVVLRDGSFAGELGGASITQEGVLRLSTGSS